jgi:hypothetical protein
MSTYSVKINKVKHEIKNNFMCFYTLIFNTSDVWMTITNTNSMQSNLILLSAAPTGHLIPVPNG